LPAQMMFAHLIRGELIPVPSVETAEAWVLDRAPPARNRRTVLGSPAEVQDELNSVAALYGADEMMLLNIMSDHPARVRSYQLIAEQFALAKQPELA
jgi:alkanesulfonate monooxygenase SsuD/methylene tetrahydromethanopterin reductase-like flavin-dependent oxidoreductase (luciferase family)